MADYPNFPILRDSSAKPKDGMQIDRAVNGSARARALWSAQKHSLTLKHILTDAERVTMDAFYATNRSLPVAVDCSLASGSFLMAAPPQYRQVALGRWEAVVALEEV